MTFSEMMQRVAMQGLVATCNFYADGSYYLMVWEKEKAAGPTGYARGRLGDADHTKALSELVLTYNVDERSKRPGMLLFSEGGLSVKRLEKELTT